MLSVYELNHKQFKSLLNTKCRRGDIWKWSPEIYAYLSGLFQEDCSDSVLREWAFQWATEGSALYTYDEIYTKWLGDN